MSSPPDLPSHIQRIVDEIETEIGDEPRRAASLIEGVGAAGDELATTAMAITVSRRPSARSCSRSARSPIARAWSGRRGVSIGCTRS